MIIEIESLIINIKFLFLVDCIVFLWEMMLKDLENKEMDIDGLMVE